MKVLIVDDSHVLARCLRSSLAEVAELEIVGHADCVADGIMEIRKAKPDVVILDIRMIMLSNYNFPQFRRKCLESGARYYFDKSTEFHRVGEVLRSLVNVPSA
jgi:DNA-binding NarL/FixJ family response regulator